MQASQRKQPPAVIFDSSIDDSIDQILALATVLVYTAGQDARPGSISVSRNSLALTSFCELMVRFYRGEQPGESPGRNAVTIGMSELGSSAAPSPMISAALSRTSADNKPLYGRTIEKLNDTADPVAVIRNALSAQQDQSAVVVLAGPPVNLLGLLAVLDSKPLIQKKVRSLVIGSPLTDASGFKKLLAEWPSPIVMASEELRNVPFPAAAIEQDFAWATNHPVVDTYRAAKPMPYDAPIGAMAAVLHAVHPDSNYFTLANDRSPAGESPRMLLADASRKDQLVQTLRQVVATRITESRRGGRGG